MLACQHVLIRPKYKLHLRLMGKTEQQQGVRCNSKSSLPEKRLLMQSLSKWGNRVFALHVIPKSLKVQSSLSSCSDAASFGCNRCTTGHVTRISQSAQQDLLFPYSVQGHNNIWLKCQPTEDGRAANYTHSSGTRGAVWPVKFLLFWRNDLEMYRRWGFGEPVAWRCAC